MKEIWDKKKEVPGAIPGNLDIPSTSELHYKKLGTFLLLLYQSYLQGETDLPAEIKMAFWRMIQFKEDFATKVRMLHQDYLQQDISVFTANWDEARDILFPMKPQETYDLSAEKENRIKEYKNTVLQLLA